MSGIIIGKPKIGAKRGKKHRKYGRNIRKYARLGKTTWSVMQAAKARKQRRHEARKERLARLRAKRGGYHTKREMVRATRFGAKVHDDAT